MLVEGKVLPAADLTLRDKQQIVTSFNFLRRAGKLNNIPGIEANGIESYNFANTFGFNQRTLKDVTVKENDKEKAKGFKANIDYQLLNIISIEPYDAFLPITIKNDNFSAQKSNLLTFAYGQQTYTLMWKDIPKDGTAESDKQLVLTDNTGKTLANFDMEPLKNIAEPTTSFKSLRLPPEQLIFTQTFDGVTITMFVREIQVVDGNFSELNADLFITFN